MERGREASPRRTGERHLRRKRSSADALGREAAVHRRGRPELLHLAPRCRADKEINADASQPLECVLVRSDKEAVVVNITDVEPVENRRRSTGQIPSIEPVTLLLACTKINSATSKSNDRDARIRDTI